jgi:hypothetical protein
MHRFGVRHFPSIYHLHQRQTREYLGGRTAGEVRACTHARLRCFLSVCTPACSPSQPLLTVPLPRPASPSWPAQLAEFARGGWRAVGPRTGCSSPVSRCGRWVGKAVSIPSRAKAAYFHLRDRKKYGDVTLLSGILAVPVALGLLGICLLDVYYTRRAPPEELHAHEL